MKYQIVVGCAMLGLFFACKTEPEASESKKAAPDAIEIKSDAESKEPSTSLFLSKSELPNTDQSSIHFSEGNEVILFRPSENDFGLLLEDTQDKSWLTVDDKFEELSTSLTRTFKEGTGLRISVVEKPLVGVSRSSDTLYFDAGKQHYGLILCNADIAPIFLPHDAKNIIEVIKSHYALE